MTRKVVGRRKRARVNSIGLIEKFETNYTEFKDLWKTFLLNPSGHEEKLITLISSIAPICHYCEEGAIEFASHLTSVLSKYGTQLDADMRLTFCRALMSVRKCNRISPVTILKLFFELFRCQDKILRETLRNYIVQDIKNVNKKSKKASLNNELQSFMFEMLKDGNITASKLSLDIVIELYNRKVWNDARTANIIATALFSKSNKLVVAALTFFLTASKEGHDSDDSDDDTNKDPRNAKQLRLAYRVGKKTNKRKKRMDRALSMVENQKEKRMKLSTCFSAIHLLNDPQDLSERVFAQLDRPKVNDLLSVKMLKLQFVSQLIGMHKLLILQFYPFLDRYLKPSQREVTKFLLFLAQACHEMVPPDVLTSSIRTITNNFVSERNSNEAMAVGLNCIREICSRCPLAMDEDLLHDLALYKKNRDKCVSMAAQSLIGLFRMKNPQLLHKSFRGKPTVAMMESEKIPEYGELDAKDYLPGAEILPDEEELKQQKEEEEAWESCSEDEDSDGSWVDVPHSSDEGEKDEETEETKEMTKEEKVEKSKKVFETRILTDDDFKKIQSHERKRHAEFSKKGKRTHEEAFPEESGELLPLATIENIHKKKKHDKESRMATVMAGREDRTKYGQRKGRMNEHASTSNKEKQKAKDFMMVRQKVLKKKSSTTFRDKKESLKTALMRKLKQKIK